MKNQPTENTMTETVENLTEPEGSTQPIPWAEGMDIVQKDPRRGDLSYIA